jgi:SET domain-containing protein
MTEQKNQATTFQEASYQILINLLKYKYSKGEGYLTTAWKIMYNKHLQKYITWRWKRISSQNTV